MNKSIYLAKRLLVDSIWTSANLEGLGTTFPKTEAILNNIPTETKTEEVLFIINMKRAWNFLLNNIDYNNCLMLLRQYNKIVGEGLFYDNGKVRSTNVSIGGTSWSPEIPIESKIIDDIEELNKISNPKDKALKYFCYIARTQMFIDGNKRVAQLMANKILIENDIGVFQVPVKADEEFKHLLIEFYESGDDKGIISFMKRYCIIEKDSKKPEYKSNKDRFEMSVSQVNVCNEILYDIRTYLFKMGIKNARITDYKGKAILTLNTIEYEGTDKDLNKLLDYTVKEIVENIPLPIKTISFSVSQSNLVHGDFKKSISEKGSVEINLQ